MERAAKQLLYKYRQCDRPWKRRRELQLQLRLIQHQHTGKFRFFVLRKSVRVSDGRTEVGLNLNYLEFFRLRKNTAPAGNHTFLPERCFYVLIFTILCYSDHTSKIISP